MIVAVGALTLGACSNPPPAPAKARPANHVTGSASGLNRAVAKTDTPAAVIQAWRAAEQTVYRYDREPWPKIRAKLIAGTPPLQLFPDLARYFTGPALSAVVQSVVGIKMDELTGAKVDRLGDPTVTSLHRTSATVSSCIFDSGTTTASGTPGPTTLDGGSGYGQGHWLMAQVNNEWRIQAGQANQVASC